MTAPNPPKRRDAAAKTAPKDAADAAEDALPASAIRVTDDIAIAAGEVEESFVRASGPGGQNVNKLATSVKLRFDVRRSPSLPAAVKARLERLAGKRLTKDGVLLITGQRHRTQGRNRKDALERLIELIRQAAIPPVPRRPTRPTAGARRRRLQAKARQSATKRLRATPDEE
ncbi:MAG: alternative ribosome rescue aminoacyl-tRNA hydrolase ArfB [Alphaproteobacteria bacterium]